MFDSALARRKFAYFFIYVGATMVIGESFPFSPFGMYSDIGNRREGAVPYARIDGVPARLSELDGFTGLDLEQMRPNGLPVSLGNIVDQDIVRVRSGLADAPPAGARLHEVEYGYRIIKLGDDGAFTYDQVVRTRGVGWDLSR